MIDMLSEAVSKLIDPLLEIYVERKKIEMRNEEEGRLKREEAYLSVLSSFKDYWNLAAKVTYIPIDRTNFDGYNLELHNLLCKFKDACQSPYIYEDQVLTEQVNRVNTFAVLLHEAMVDCVNQNRQVSLIHPNESDLTILYDVCKKLTEHVSKKITTH